MTDMPTATLSNGIIVANFSSPHPFTFVDGTVLDACSDERARSLMLHAEEIPSPGIKGTTDIKLTFVMSDAVREALEAAKKLPVDIILVPLPVMKSLGPANMHMGKCRSIRMADRVKKHIHIDKFCVS